MSERSELIARKQSIQARIVQLQRNIERERLRSGGRSKKIAQMDAQIEQLQAEEGELRQQIDRAPE
jgi:predicted  nucleic acid-binding Zn-ribbon protein